LCSLFFASPSKAETVWNGETFGDWRFECGTRSEGVTKCALVQSIIDTVTNQTMVRLSFARSTVDGMVTASVLLPLGVELAENATMHYGAEKMSLNRPGFTGGQNSRRIARHGTDTKEEDLEAVFT